MRLNSNLQCGDCDHCVLASLCLDALASAKPQSVVDERIHFMVPRSPHQWLCLSGELAVPNRARWAHCVS